jgi:putative oxidoreductase
MEPLSSERIAHRSGLHVHLAWHPELFAFPVLEPRNPVPLSSLLGMAGLLELVGGLLLFLGVFTRPVAFLLSGEMAVAYFMAHASRNFWPILNGGEVAVLFCFVWLFLAAAGPGPWSLDALRTSEADPRNV